MDASRLQLTGPATSLVEAVAFDAITGRADLDISPDGILVYRRGKPEANRIVAWLDRSGKVQPVLSKPGNYFSPRLSPDGKRLAVVSVNSDRKVDLWVHDFARDAMTRLTFDSEPKGVSCLDAGWRLHRVRLAAKPGLDPVRRQRPSGAPGTPQRGSAALVHFLRQ